MNDASDRRDCGNCRHFAGWESSVQAEGDCGFPVPLWLLKGTYNRRHVVATQTGCPCFQMKLGRERGQ